MCKGERISASRGVLCTRPDYGRTTARCGVLCRDGLQVLLAFGASHGEPHDESR